MQYRIGRPGSRISCTRQVSTRFKDGSIWRMVSEAPYLNMDAMSIIRGMSKEKPALDLLRCMDIAWSLYDRTGDKIKKMGAT